MDPVTRSVVQTSISEINASNLLADSIWFDDNRWALNESNIGYAYYDPSEDIIYINRLSSSDRVNIDEVSAWIVHELAHRWYFQNMTEDAKNAFTRIVKRKFSEYGMMTASERSQDSMRLYHIAFDNISGQKEVYRERFDSVFWGFEVHGRFAGGASQVIWIPPDARIRAIPEELLPFYQGFFSQYVLGRFQ